MFCTSPERAGLFESTFWHRQVLVAAYHSPAIYHAAIAVGALYEHVHRGIAGQGWEDRGSVEFALLQCNRSINLLTASTDGDLDPGVALITCILFACFEAINGDSAQAIAHSLQGRKLLRACEQLTEEGKATGLVESSSVRPVVGGLEIQAKAIQGRAMQPSDLVGEPPLPDIPRLHSLHHANWTLHYAWISLLVFCQHIRFDFPDELALHLAEKHRLFLPWLRQWESSFSEFLFRESGLLSTHELARAKVLKANHIMASMLAAIDFSEGQAAWDEHDADFKSVIDLSASALNTFCTGTHAIITTSQFPFLTFGLWVAEPLFITMARSGNPDLRRQAAGLLSGQPGSLKHRGASLHGESTPHGTADNTRHVSAAVMKGFGASNNAPGDVSRWSTDQWIEFASSARLDVAMAIYFGRFEPDSIDRPPFHKLRGG